jgi:hypothetical protein
MNDASLQKHRPLRTAAAVAIAIGATLLATPGTAAAQIDCAALGDDPLGGRIGPALDIALECGIEVRVTSSSWNHATVSVTPEGQLHLVSTAEPVQDYEDDGAPDPVLADFEGSLTQTNAHWPVWLRRTDGSYPLIETRAGILDWTGETPVPEYGGTTAVYDELAPGLDLAVDLDISTFDLRFTAADAAAWEALATGLRAEGHYAPMLAVDGSLRIQDEDDYLTEWTTPLTVRDADGTAFRADLALAEDGALAVDVSEEAFAEAAYPLTLTGQWASRSYMESEWGSVASAAPDLALYRGEAGLDEPYFEAAGQGADTVAGAYCDMLNSTECVDAEAIAYWNFDSRAADVRTPSVSYDFDYPVTSATFRVDAAAGADCAAPALDFTEDYSTAATWNDRPAVIGAAASGTCQDGTAVYDLTEAVAERWDDPETAADLTLATAPTTETARFDGGSARLDVYFDIVGLNSIHWCSTDPGAPDFYQWAADALVYAHGWRDEDLDLGLTWAATIRDRDTGDTVLTSEPEPLRELGESFGSSWMLPDGAYEIEYRIDSGTTGAGWTLEPCQVVVDSIAPEILDVTVEDGPHTIGDTVSIEVEIAEAGFPDGLDLLVVSLHNRTDFGVVDSAALTDTGTALLEVQLTGPENSWWLQVEDRAGNELIPDEMVTVRASADSLPDYDGDEQPDLFAVRRSDGNLVLYSGEGDGTLAAGVSKGAGWGGFDLAMAGDLTGDGNADLLARDTKTGVLYTYPGNGLGGFGTRTSVGSGWNGMGAFTSAGDFDQDGHLDLLAVSRADGKLYRYPGNGDGTFGARTALGSGWGVMDALTTVGDVNRDGYFDLLAHDAKSGSYYVYYGNSAGGVGGRAAIDASIDGAGAERYSQIAAQDGDGDAEIAAVDSRTGDLVFFPFNATGTKLDTGETVAPAWGGLRLGAVNLDRPYDHTGDGNTDVLARNGSTGTTYVYPGTGTGGFGTALSWGTGLAALDLIETAGDFTGDGFSDAFGRTTGGVLYVYPGNGTGGYNAAGALRIGGGWNAMSTVIGGQDYNSDGRTDILARESATGNLWLYPGTGTGSHGARVLIGTGWNSMSLITAVGDLDHDGVADVLARKNSDDCLYFYAGKATGGVKNGVQIGCGWDVMNAVAAVGDFNGDGHVDWVARHSNGSLYLYAGNGKGSYASSKVIGSGWGGMDLIA